MSGFVPAVITPEAVSVPAFGPETITPTASSSAVPALSRTEIALKNGQRIIVEGPPDIEAVLRRTRARGAAMIPVPVGAKMWLATGHTDMRKGFASLSLLVQEILKRDPLGGHIFCFRGRRGDLIKITWHDGQVANLYVRRIERGRFLWPSPADGSIAITPAQMAYLLSGVDWRIPIETWRPTSVG